MKWTSGWGGWDLQVGRQIDDTRVVCGWELSAIAVSRNARCLSQIRLKPRWDRDRENIWKGHSPIGSDISVSGWRIAQYVYVTWTLEKSLLVHSRVLIWWEHSILEDVPVTILIRQLVQRRAWESITATCLDKSDYHQDFQELPVPSSQILWRMPLIVHAGPWKKDETKIT
jgi:hypothetical protein